MDSKYSESKKLVNEYQSGYQSGFIAGLNSIKKNENTKIINNNQTDDIINEEFNFDINHFTINKITNNELDLNTKHIHIFLFEFLDNLINKKCNKIIENVNNNNFKIFLDSKKTKNYFMLNLFYFISGLIYLWIEKLDKNNYFKKINCQKRNKYLEFVTDNQIKLIHIITCLEKTLIFNNLLEFKNHTYLFFIINLYHGCISQFMDKKDGFNIVNEEILNNNLELITLNNLNIDPITLFFWHNITIDIINYLNNLNNKYYDKIINQGKEIFLTYEKYHNHNLKNINQLSVYIKSDNENILNKLYPMLYKFNQIPIKYPDLDYKTIEEAIELSNKINYLLKNNQINEIKSQFNHFYKHISLFTDKLIILC